LGWNLVKLICALLGPGWRQYGDIIDWLSFQVIVIPGVSLPGPNPYMHASYLCSALLHTSFKYNLVEIYVLEKTYAWFFFLICFSPPIKVSLDWCDCICKSMVPIYWITFLLCDLLHNNDKAFIQIICGPLHEIFSFIQLC